MIQNKDAEKIVSFIRNVFDVVDDAIKKKDTRHLETLMKIFEQSKLPCVWAIWSNNMLRRHGNALYEDRDRWYRNEGLYFKEEVAPGIYKYDSDVQERIQRYTKMYLRAFRFFYAPIYGIRQPLFNKENGYCYVHHRPFGYLLNVGYLLNEGRFDDFPYAFLLLWKKEALRYKAYSSIFDMPEIKVFGLCEKVHLSLAGKARMQLMEVLDNFAWRFADPKTPMPLAENMINFAAQRMIEARSRESMHKAGKCRCPWVESAYMPRLISSLLPGTDYYDAQGFVDQKKLAEGWKQVGKELRELAVTPENVLRSLENLLGKELFDRFCTEYDPVRVVNGYPGKPGLRETMPPFFISEKDFRRMCDAPKILCEKIRPELTEAIRTESSDVYNYWPDEETFNAIVQTYEPDEPSPLLSSESPAAED